MLESRKESLRQVHDSFGLMWRALRTNRPSDPALAGLSLQHCELLFQLKDQRELAVKDIAQRFGITGSAATQMVDSLEERGIVERFPSTADQRVTLVRLTASARGQAEGIRARHEERLGELLAALDDSELAQLASLLSKISTANFPV